jgi:hypothetical protein
MNQGNMAGRVEDLEFARRYPMNRTCTDLMRDSLDKANRSDKSEPLMSLSMDLPTIRPGAREAVSFDYNSFIISSDIHRNDAPV